MACELLSVSVASGMFRESWPQLEDGGDASENFVGCGAQLFLNIGKQSPREHRAGYYCVHSILSRLRIIPVSGKRTGNVELTQRSAWIFNSSIVVEMAVGLSAGSERQRLDLT